MLVPPLLTIKNLSVEFTSIGRVTRAVDRVSFELRRSETLAIVGESGSGKSVTALTILRLLPSPPGRVAGGEVLYYPGEQDVVDLLRADENTMRSIRGRDISMVFQEPMSSLNPVFTCGNQVAESLKMHMGVSAKVAKSRVIQLFKEVKLPRPEEVYRSYPHQLSGGQKQRVMIAMAISCDPKIIIADEPTTALDVTVQKTILELLKRIQEKRKIGILFITHDLGLVSGFADRVLVMYKGNVVEEGRVSTVFAAPKHPYTKGLLACRPPLDFRPERLPTIDEFLKGGAVFDRDVISPVARASLHNEIYHCEPIIRVEGVSKVYGQGKGWWSRDDTGFFALDKVSLDVYSGETLGIVGESGSGKTTLARVLLELIPVTMGKIFYKEFEITQITYRMMKRLRKDLQIIFQDPYSSLNPRLTIGHAIQEPMLVHGLHRNKSTRKQRAIELLRQVGLTDDHYHRFPHELSGGQRQRVCIARALAVEPKLVICDESVSALDVSIQAQVLNLLNDLKKAFDLTYIFISHDLSVVKYMSDRLIVMRDGKIEEAGEADSIYGNPVSEYTKMLLESIPRAKQVIFTNV